MDKNLAKSNTASVIFYTLKDGVIDKIGLIEDEACPGYFKLLEINISNESSTMLSVFRKIISDIELKIDDSCVKYLGFISRDYTIGSYNYAADITLVENIPSKIKIIDINEMNNISDSTSQASFLRLFSSLYKNTIIS